MIFYASGEMKPPVIEYVGTHGLATLTSYAYKGMLIERTAKLATLLRANNKRMPHMIDSGAFTSWSLNKPVNIKQLVDAYNRLNDLYNDCMDFTFVSLDVIPGKRGVDPTAEDFKFAHEQSAKNYHYMHDHVHGKLKPVFHTGDPWQLAEVEYKQAEHIGIGMSQDLVENLRVLFAQTVALRLKDKKLHGLAATGSKMLRAVRWHSVDSAGWVYCAAMGDVKFLDGNGMMTTISVSEHSPRRKRAEGHVSNIGKQQKEAMEQSFKRAGFSYEQLSTNYALRSLWNLLQYIAACNAADDWHAHTKRGVQGGLF